MAKKKIAFVTPVYLPANLYGSDMYVREIAEALAAHGHDATVITSRALSPLHWYDPFFAPRVPAGSETIQGVRVVRLPCNQLFSLFHYIRFRLTGSVTAGIAYQGPAFTGLADVLVQEQFDVIHTSPFPLYLNKQVVDSISKCSKKPRLVQTPFFHAHVDAYKNSQLSELFSRADAIHVITPSEKKDIARMHTVPEKKMYVIPLFLDTRPMHAAASLKAHVSDFKRTHGLHKKKIVLFAGLKGSMKGAIDVLHAVDALHRNDSSIVLVAMGHNTAEWEAAKKMVNPDCLVDLGYTTGIEKETVFAACDVYAMPSKSDSFGLVYLEAWHKKKPVIAADVAAARDLIGKHAGGVLVPYANRKKLQEALVSLLTTSTSGRKSGINGYRALMEYYTLSSVYDAYETLCTGTQS